MNEDIDDLGQEMSEPKPVSLKRKVLWTLIVSGLLVVAIGCVVLRAFAALPGMIFNPGKGMPR